MAAVRLGNSFLDAPARGQKVLVIVPHEDDEINVAGSIMYSFLGPHEDARSLAFFADVRRTTCFFPRIW